MHTNDHTAVNNATTMQAIKWTDKQLPGKTMLRYP